MTHGQRLLPWWRYGLLGARIRFDLRQQFELRSWWFGRWRPLTFRRVALPFEIGFDDRPDNPWLDPNSP